VEDVIIELRKFANGWMGYFGISHTYREVMELDSWIRRRVRLYYWKQWKRPHTRRRNLLKLGADPKKVHMATRSRKGPWRLSANSIVCKALTDRWLKEPAVAKATADRQGVPEMRYIWIKLHYGGVEPAPGNRARG